ncbi:hypothetical protein GC207_14390 [bacterium]|nr:hypothetical protein [bacterium]
MVRLIVIFALLCSGTMHAASWYVDNAASGSNNGSSWANAWKSFDDVVWGNSGINAGDTLFISGGATSKTYVAPNIVVGESGTADKRITLRVGQDAGHNGVVVFDYNSLGDTATTEGILCTYEWIVFDGEYNGSSHWKFANLRNQINRATAYAIRGWNATGVEVKWITFTNCNEGPRFHNTAYGRIHNNFFQQIRGDAAIGLFGSPAVFDSALIYSNVIQTVKNGSVPPGGSGSYSGPDGIQASSGTSIFKNNFSVSRTTSVFTSTQHPDCLQLTGTHHKVYQNEFVNVGDSAIDFDVYRTDRLTNVWIFNNVFRLVDSTLDPYPEFIRVYGSQGDLLDISNFKILNNTFVDNKTFYPIRFTLNAYTPTGTGNEIKNNIFYNCGNGTVHRIVDIKDSPNYQAGSWSFANNIYYNDDPSMAYINFRGTNYLASDWVTSVGIERNGNINKPAFVGYTPNGPANDFHLKATDTAATGKGVNLGAMFSTDKDGALRTTWDVGAYASANNPISIDKPVIDISVLPGAIASGESATLSWSTANATTFSVSGVGALSLSGQQTVSPTATTTYTATAVGLGGVTTQSVTLVVTNPPVSLPPPGQWVEAETAVVTQPFVIAGGMVYQSIESGVTDGGQLSLQLNVPVAGDYAVAAWLDAPSDFENSLFFNFDSQPSDPFMVWDIPITTGAELRLGSWRGSGTFDQAEYAPKFFSLSAGQHQLIIRGREKRVRIDKLMLVKRPAPISVVSLQQ